MLVRPFATLPRALITSLFRSAWCGRRPARPLPWRARTLRTKPAALCRSGRGGDGEVMEKGKGRMVRNFKYKPGRGMPKQIWLAASDPADGEAGADVALVVDTAVRAALCRVCVCTGADLPAGERGE